jgi:hypothetical protein
MEQSKKANGIFWDHALIENSSLEPTVNKYIFDFM